MSAMTSHRAGAAPQEIVRPPPRGTTASSRLAAACSTPAAWSSVVGVATQLGTTPPTLSGGLAGRTTAPVPARATAISAPLVIGPASGNFGQQKNAQPSEQLHLACGGRGVRRPANPRYLAAQPGCGEHLAGVA